ncbi:MAG TPA: hypothetical protein VL283_01600 [Candidatus Baltobacteraceae bacterium]|nr:hypothetical protein [Candidatus Baltobacteraceae bacterium]
MEWQTEAVDQNARPLADAVATLVKEMPEIAHEMPAIVQEIPKAELAPAKAATLRAILRNVRDSLDNALKLLEEDAPSSEEYRPEPKVLSFAPKTDDGSALPALVEGDRVVEGVFDGMGMVGGDGKGYLVPPNYASKSKLVEGDMLKLTIGARGNFIYKQIGPIERQRIVGTLAYDQETGQYLVVAGGRSWKVLKASITYFKADAGDEAVILAPKNAPSKWAAVENVIKKIALHPPTP